MKSFRNKRKIIENYINAYNSFDINGMMRDMHDDVKFENISGGQVNVSTNGAEELRNQAEIAKVYFKERIIEITDFVTKGEIIEIKVNYTAVLARDMPDGLKAGDTIKLEGRSIFRFRDNKIINLQDIS